MIIPLGYAQVTHNFVTSGIGRRAAITYGVQLEGTDFGETRAANLYTAFQTEVMPQLTTNLLHAGVTIKYGPTATGAFFEHAGTGVGGKSGEGMSPNNAYLVRKRTALGGRANRGRLYLPGVDENNVNEAGQVGDTASGLIQDAIDDWEAALETIEMPMVILHTGSGDPTPVTSLIVDNTLATQRRRLR